LARKKRPIQKTHKRDPQKRNTKEKHKREIQKSNTKEEHKRDPHQRSTNKTNRRPHWSIALAWPTSKDSYERPTKETRKETHTDPQKRPIIETHNKESQKKATNETHRRPYWIIALVWPTSTSKDSCGVATISRLLKIKDLFGRI